MNHPDRRSMLGAAAWALGSGGLRPPLARSAPRPDLVRAENDRDGTTDWQLTYTRTDPAAKWRSSIIEGFVSKPSVAAGETLDVFVSTDPPADVTIDVYRLGYYRGAGGRHVARVGPRPATLQPTPGVGDDRLRECAWRPFASLKVPPDWPSGVYLGKLSSAAHRYQSYVIFVVRDDRPADFLFQCSDNTWQAYNQWPLSHSLYTNDRKDGKVLVPGVRVSYDRPYGKYVQIFDNPLSQGSGEFLLWEFPLAYWMEARGYDVTYCSNTDVHRGADTLLRCKAFLSVGHDEYWSRPQYDHVAAAIKAGVHAAFLSGNTCMWVTPLTPSTTGTPDRVLTRAGRFGGVRESERPYVADMPVTDAPSEALLIGAQTITPFNGSGDWVVTKPDHWLFAGTGMKAGDRIPGLVGWEFHGGPADIPGLEVVAEGDTLNTAGKSARYTATVYPGPKGNVVFNASTIFWAQGLSAPPGHMPPISHFGRPHGPDRRVQRITKNLFDRMRA